MGKKRNRTNDISPAAQLRLELQSTNQALRHAYDKFNFASEPELVEACSYEISSLKARYNYLLRQMKELTDYQPAASKTIAQPAAPEAAQPEDMVSCVAAAIMKGGPACPS